MKIVVNKKAKEQLDNMLQQYGNDKAFRLIITSYS